MCDVGLLSLFGRLCCCLKTEGLRGRTGWRGLVVEVWASLSKRALTEATYESFGGTDEAVLAAGVSKWHQKASEVIRVHGLHSTNLHWLPYQLLRCLVKLRPVDWTEI